MPRLFFAIPVPEGIRLPMVSSFPKQTFPGIRFMMAEQLHITIHFIGDTSDQELPSMLSAANNLILSSAALDLKFDSFKTILQNEKPIMIWAQFSESDDFSKLCLGFREAFPTGEDRKPIPHITIARIRQRRQIPFALPQMKPFSFAANRIELWQSHLHSAGAVYSVISSWSPGKKTM